MLRALLIFYIFSKTSLNQIAQADENQQKIAFDLIEKLEIRQCIRIIKEKFDFNNLNILKDFSEHNIEISLFTKEFFLEYLKGDHMVYWSTAVIIETDSLSLIQEIFENLKKAKKGHDVSKFSWFIFLNKAEGFEIEANQLSVPYDCQLIVVREIRPNLYDLKEIYDIKNIKISNSFGTWDKSVGLIATNEPFYVRRKSLHNVTLIYAADVNRKGYCPPGGYLGCAKREVLYDMERMIDFNLQFVRFQRGRRDDYADIYDSRSSFHSYFFTYDSIAPMFKAYLNWYIKDPEVEPRQDFYIQPFEVDLWYSLLSAIFISSLVIVMIGYFNKRLRGEPPLPQLIDNIFTAFECVCSQDGGEYRDYASFRIALITILLTCLFIVPSYLAVITSFLAVRIPKIPFRNVEEFVQNGKYILIRKEGAVFPELYFKQNKNPLIKLVNEKFVEATTEEDGLRKTCRGLYTMTAPNIYLKDDNAECSFYQIPKAITFYFLQLTLSKHSVFRDAFMHILPPFYSNGVMMHLQEDLDEVPIKDTDENVFYPVRLHQMAHIFLMVVFGCGLGIIILCFEIAFKYFRKLRLLRNKNKLFKDKETNQSALRRKIKDEYDLRVNKQVKWY